ncbi:TetR/AcrR family transcriptional regulator [Nesterenkonia sandarakina]|uniref:TetR family transcriptional regulator n=1 Tax=Nesterenkonia sandarakina TaxID=272918 RepID=A0A2T0YDK6_9MICC|nr:TetR/AcrR family transcriptional regulator [Nesterenkonia sandarakina]PRZ12904.1 TetR family transcriptional regulator [Nesterenkonia sandarakina]
MTRQGDARRHESADPLRQVIIEAADELYYANGFRAVGMDALRQRAGVSLKRLYTVFPSKESIVLAVLDYRHQIWADEIAAAVAQQATPRDRLLAIYDYLAGWFRSDSFRGCVFINAFGELASESPAVATKAADHKRDFRRYMERLATEAGFSEELGDQLMLLAEGAQTTAAITGDSSMALKARRAAETLLGAEASAQAQSVP